MEFLDANGLKTLCNEIKKYISSIKESLEQNNVNLEKFKATVGVDAGKPLDDPRFPGAPFSRGDVNSCLQDFAKSFDTLNESAIKKSNISTELTKLLKTVGGQSLIKTSGSDSNIPIVDTSNFVTNNLFEHVLGNDDVLYYNPLGAASVQDIVDNIDERISSIEENPMILFANAKSISRRSQLSGFEINDIVYCQGELDKANAGTNKSTINKFIVIKPNNTYVLAPAPYNIYNEDGSIEVNADNIYITRPIDGGIYVIMKNPFNGTEKDWVNINDYLVELVDFYDNFAPDFNAMFGRELGSYFEFDNNLTDLQAILTDVSNNINTFKSKLNYVEIFIDTLQDGIPQIDKDTLEKIHNNNPSYLIINGSWCKYSNDSFYGHFTIADSANDFHTTVYSGLFVIDPNNGYIVIDQGNAENLDDKFQSKFTHTSQLATINGSPLYYGGSLNIVANTSTLEAAINEQKVRIDTLEQKIDALTETVNNLSK